MKTFALDLDNYQKLISNAATIFQYAPPVTRLRGQPWVINGRYCPGGCRVAFGRFVLITCTPGPDSQPAHCASDVPRLSLSLSLSLLSLSLLLPCVPGCHSQSPVCPLNFPSSTRTMAREKKFCVRTASFTSLSVQFSFAPFHYACVPLSRLFLSHSLLAPIWFIMVTARRKFWFFIVIILW